MEVLSTKDGKTHATKVIEIKTTNGKVVESITVGATVGTDARSNIYNADFGEAKPNAKGDEIRGAMSTGRDIYEVENGYSKPIVINQNGSKYFIQDKNTADKNAEDYTYYVGNRKVGQRKYQYLTILV